MNEYGANRVIYISSVDVSLGNGPGVNEREFIISLSEILKDNVTFLIPKPKEKITDEEFPFDNCVYSYRYSRGEKKRFLPHTISQIVKGLCIVRKQKPNLLVFRLGAMPISQYIISKFSNTKYVTKTIGPKLLYVFENETGLLYKIIRKSNSFLMKNIIRNSIGNDAVSEKHIKGLKEVFGENLSIIMNDNTVNTTRFQKGDITEARNKVGLNKYKYVVGYAGNFPHERGGLQMIEIAPRLIEKYGSIAFVVLGAGRGYEKLINRSKELGVYENCIFTGVVPFEDVPLWISTFDVGISFLEPQSSGASEQKIRQYLACGKPVVCSHGSSSFVEENKLGKLSKWDDHDSIYNNISYYLDLEKQTMLKVQNACRDFAVNNLSVKSSTLKRLNYWDKVLTSK